MRFTTLTPMACRAVGPEGAQKNSDQASGLGFRVLFDVETLKPKPPKLGGACGQDL